MKSGLLVKKAVNKTDFWGSRNGEKRRKDFQALALRTTQAPEPYPRDGEKRCDQKHITIWRARAEPILQRNFSALAPACPPVTRTVAFQPQ